MNLVEPGDKVIVCKNGVFGSRMLENVKRCGGIPVLVEDAWGAPVSVEKVAAAFADHPDTRVLAFVHAETSTGARSDAQALAALAHQHGALVIVDAVTSLAGIPLLVDEWELDAVYSGSQKCLSCTPGLSPVTFNERAIAKLKSRSTPVQSWFLDLNLVLGYWGSVGKRTYHHTAPVNPLYGLHEALVLLTEEGLENSWTRHARNHEMLRDGLDAMGLRFEVDKDYRLPQLNTIRIPANVDDAAVRAQLLSEFNLEIGAGLGDLAGKVWRIGLMGHSSRPENIDLFLTGLRKAMAA